MKFNHGVAAYGANLYLDIVKIVDRTIEIIEGKHPDWELSCSREDQYVGPMGFTCTGECTDMYSRDCNSYVNADGHRTSNLDMLKCDIDGWYKSTAPYTEAFVKDIKVTGLWIKKSIYEDYTEYKNTNGYDDCIDEWSETKELLSTMLDYKIMFSNIERLICACPNINIVDDDTVDDDDTDEEALWEEGFWWA